MANDNNIRFKVGLDVDSKSIAEIRKELSDLKMSLYDKTGKNTMSLTEGLKPDEAKKKLAEVRQSIDSINKALKDAYNTDLGTVNIAKFNQSLKNLNLQKIANDFNSIGSVGKKAFVDITSQVLTTNLQLKETNKFLDSMAISMSNTIKWGITSSIMNNFTGSVQKAYSYVRDLDESLTNIRIVAGKSSDEMATFAQNANDAAQALGTTTTKYTDAALIYYQQGLSNEEVIERTNTTMQMANVLGESADKVSSYMTAIWNNFDNGSKSLEYYGDVVTALGAKTAASSEEIAQGLEKFASVAESTGLSYEYATASLATVVAATRQSADTVGTAFKTIFARLQGLNLGETLDDGTTLNKYSQALQAVGISIKDQNGELKKMDAILDEMGNKWTTLSNDQQIALAQTVAGTRQYNQLVALMQNWEDVQKNINVARNASGTLDEQQEIYMDSMEAHLKNLKASQEELYTALFDSDSFKDLIDALSGITNGFSTFVKGIGGGGNALLGLGSIAVTVLNKQIGEGLNYVISQFSNASYNAKQFAAQLEITQKYKDLGIGNEAIQNLVTMREEAINFNSVMNQQQQEEVNGYIQATAQLEKEKIEWDEKLQSATDFYNLISGENEDISGIKQMDYGNDNANEIIEKLKEEKKYREEIAESIERSKKLIKDVTKAQLESNNQTGKNRNKNNILKDSINKLKQETNKIATEIGNGLTNNIYTSEHQEKLSKALLKYREDMKKKLTPDEVKASAQELLNVYNEVNQEMINSADETIFIIDQEFNNASGKIEENLKRAKDAWEKFKKGLSAQAIAQGLTKIVGAMGQLISAYNSLKNIGKIFEDEDLSTSEKYAQILSSLSMIITSVGMAIGTLKSLAGPLTVGIKDIAAAMTGASAEIMGLGTAMLTIAPWILGIGLAIAAVVSIVYKLVKAYNEDRDAAESSKKELEELTSQYQKLANAAKELKTEISDFKDSEKYLDGLKKGTDEYTEALEKANNQAKDLIEKYKLFDKWHFEGDLIKIDDEVLESLQKEKDLQTEKARENMLAGEIFNNNAQLRYETTKTQRQVQVGQKVYNELGYYHDEEGNLVYSENPNYHYEKRNISDDELENLLSNFSKWKNEINFSDDNWLKEQIDSLGLDLVIDDLSDFRNKIKQLSDSQDEAKKANEYYADQLFSSELKKNGVTDKDNIANAIVSIVSKKGKFNYDEEFTKIEEKYKDTTKETLTSEDENIKSDEDVKLTYAKEVLNIENATADTEGNIVDAEGEIVVKKGKNLDLMAKEIIMQRAKDELLNKYNNENQDAINTAQEALDKLSNGAKENGEKYGVDFVNAIVTNIQNKNFAEGENAKLDLSSLFSEIDDKEIEQLKAMDADELLKFLGINEEDLGDIGFESAEVFLNAWRNGLSDWNLTAYLEGQLKKTKQQLNSVSDAINSLISGKDLTEDQIESLQSLEQEYDELSAIQDRNSTAYLNKLLEIRESLEQQRIAMKEALVSEKLDQVIAVEVTDNDSTDKLAKALDELCSAEYEVLVEVKSDIQDDFDTITNKMDAIQEIAGKIGEDFLVAADDIEELNDVFPGILANMELVGDGTVKLNSEIVESAKAAAKQEIATDTDKTVEKLKNQADELITKRDTAKQIAAYAKKLSEQEKIYASQEIHMKNLTNQLEVDNNKKATEKNQAELINEGETAKDVAQDMANNFSGAYEQMAKDSIEWAKTAHEALIYATEKNTTEAPTAGEFGGFKGKTTAQIKTADEVNFEDFEDSKQEYYAKLAEEYNNLATSFDEAANNTYGKIAEILARSQKKLESKNNKSKEGSTKNAELNDELNIYHDIDIIIKQLANDYSNLEKQKKRASGKEYIDILNKELAVLDKQNQASEYKLELAKEDAATRRSRLEGMGATFNEDGEIDNYIALMKVKQDEVNAINNAYNAMSSEEQKSYKETVDKAKKDYDEFKKQLSEYEKLVNDTIPGLKNQIEDTLDKQIDIQIEKFNMEFEVTLNLTKATKEWNNFKTKVIDGMKDWMVGATTANAREVFSNMSSYYSAGGAGQIQVGTKRTNDIMSEINKMNNGETSSVYSAIYTDAQGNEYKVNDYEKAYKALESSYSQLMSDMIEYENMIDKINDDFLKGIDNVKNAYDEEAKVYSFIRKQLDHDLKMTEFLYGPKAHKRMAEYYNKQLISNSQQVSSLKEQVSYWKQLMDVARDSGDTQSYEKYKANWMATIDSINSAVDTWAEDATNRYKNTISDILDELEKKLTNGLGLDSLSDELSFMKKESEWYLDKINQAYALEKQQGKWREAINEASPQVQKKLNAAMETQMKNLREKEKLTQYDVERAEKEYEIELKKIALEEAQANKSTMRLKRDANGNYSYQFTANQDEIDKAQGDLAAAQNDLYNFDKEHLVENEQMAIEVVKEFYAEVERISNDNTLSEEEKQAKLLELQQRTQEELNYITDENTTIRKNITNSAYTEATALKETEGQVFHDVTIAETEDFVGQLVPQITSGTQEMINKFATDPDSFSNMCQEAFADVKQAGIDFNEVQEDIKETAEETSKQVEEESKVLQAEARNAINAEKQELEALKAVREEVNRMIESYKKAASEAKAAAQAAYELWQKNEMLKMQSGKVSYGTINVPQGTAQGNDINTNANGGSGSGSGVNNNGTTNTSNDEKIIYYGEYRDREGKYKRTKSTYNTEEEARKAAEEEAKNSDSDYARLLNSLNAAKSINDTRLIAELEERLKKAITVGSQTAGFGYRSFDTGGYTGAWGSDGRVALLHQKELVLNAHDTENMFNIIDMVRNITDSIKGSVLNNISSLVGLISNGVDNMVNTQKDTIEQQVHIEAIFNKETTADEIEKALNNLVNTASQYANRNLR